MPKSEKTEIRSSARLTRLDYSVYFPNSVHFPNVPADRSIQQPKKRTNEREIVGFKKTVDFMANSMMKLQQVINELVEDKGKEAIIKDVRKGNQNPSKKVLQVELGVGRKKVMSPSSLGQSDGASVKKMSGSEWTGKGNHEAVAIQTKAEWRHEKVKGMMGGNGTLESPFEIEDEQDDIVCTTQVTSLFPPASFEMPPPTARRGLAVQMKWDRVNSMFLDRKNYTTRRSEHYCERCRRLGWPCMEKRDPTARKACLTCNSQTCSLA